MYLLATSGPLAGTTIQLTNGVTIRDAEGEAPACRIGSTADGAFELHVTDGDVPVFVNGLPVTARTLESRDEVRIGDSLWVAHEDEPAPPSALVACPARLTAA